MLTKKLVSVAVLFAANSIAQAAGYSEHRAPDHGVITVTVLQPQSAAAIERFRQGGLHDFILEEFKISIDPLWMVEDTWTQELSRRFAANDLPDVFAGISGVSIDLINDWGANGRLYPVDELLHVAPELEHMYEHYPESKLYNTADDGHIYYIPSGYDKPMYFGGIAIRSDLVEKANYDLTTVIDFDDYVDLYRALVIANDNKPLINSVPDIRELLLMPFNSVGLDDPSALSYDDSDGRFFFPYTTEEACFAVDWVRDLYTEGILHPDILTHRSEGLELSEGSGVRSPPAVFQSCVRCAYDYEYGYKLEHPDETWEYVVMKPPQYRGDIKHWRMPLVGGEIGVALSSAMSSMNAERTMGMFDWFRSNQGSATARFGRKDLDWTLIDGTPHRLYTGPGSQYTLQEEWTSVAETAWGNFLSQESWGHLDVFGKMVEKEWVLKEEWTGSNLYDRFIDHYQPTYSHIYRRSTVPLGSPLYGFPHDLRTMEKNLFGMAHEWSANAIRKGFDPSEWSDLQDRLRDLGLDAYELRSNNWYAERLISSGGGGGRVHRRREEIELPMFPLWTGSFPEPSLNLTIEPSKLGLEGASEIKLEKVGDAIDGVLQGAGYTRRYFRVPDGVVIATDLRPYECDSAQCDQIILFVMRGGDDDIGEAYRDSEFYVRMGELIGDGLPSLPESVGGLPYGGSFTSRVFVYQFLKLSNEVRFVTKTLFEDTSVGIQWDDQALADLLEQSQDDQESD